MRISALLVWLAAVAWTPAFAQTETESERIAWTLERGRLIFEIDRAAWVGTDDMLERMPDPANSGMRGYIVERDGPGCLNMRVPPGLLDPVPTEIHVFSAMTSGFAIGVATGVDSLWRVTGEGIRLVDEMPLFSGT